MSIIERLEEAEQSLREAEVRRAKESRQWHNIYQEKAQSQMREVKNIAAKLAEMVALNQIFDELRTHLTEQNFEVEVKEITELVPLDNYYPIFACSHSWFFLWRKHEEQTVNMFLVSVEHDPPFFNLRVTGGGTGETTTDFDLGSGVENINPQRLKKAVAKAFVKPIQKTIKQSV